MKHLLILFILCSLSIGFAGWRPPENIVYDDTLFVATSGSDENPGTQSQPFRTVQKALDNVKAGTLVYIRQGSYKSRLDMIKLTHGTEEKWIKVAGFPGETIELDYSLQVGTWSEQSNGIWKASPPSFEHAYEHFTECIVVNNENYHRVYSLNELTPGSFYAGSEVLSEANNGDIYLLPKAGVNPNTASVYVINGRNSGSGLENTKPSGFRQNNSEYIWLENVAIRGAVIGFWGYRNWFGKNPDDMYRGSVIKNVLFEHTLNFSINHINFKNILIDNCHIRNGGLWNWPRDGRRNWPHQIIGYNADDGAILNTEVALSHGEGLGPFLDCSNWEIRNCVAYDNWGINFYLDSDEEKCIVDGNLAYNTNIWYDANPEDERNLTDGIRIANENADFNEYTGDNTPAITEVQITNNIVINCPRGITSFSYGPNNVSYLKNSLIAHNTVVATKQLQQMGWDGGINLKKGDDVRIVNNLTNRPIKVLSQQGAGVSVTNNIASEFSLGSGISGSNNTTTDPQWVGGAVLRDSSYMLKPSSPAVDAGIALSEVTTDYFGNNRSIGQAPDLGAIEFTNDITGFVLKPITHGVEMLSHLQFQSTTHSKRILLKAGTRNPITRIVTLTLHGQIIKDQYFPKRHVIQHDLSTLATGNYVLQIHTTRNVVAKAITVQ